ncbi:T9SS type A sorting domain-containing protein [Rubrivirga sp. IMCC45206]|uniref:T9SS type A sorting domain-containing protein n=1 Tax=Rubrivirga sp. IMCC45206 TaxID=3391614 RepID=UPI00398FFFFD
MPRLLLSILSRSTALLVVAASLVAPAALAQDVVFDSFDDGDVSDIGFFSGGAAGIGIGVGTTAGADGADAAGLSVGINPGDGGGFAGVVIPGPEGVTDVSGAEFLTFSFRPTTVQAANLPLKLEIALQEDEDGDGAHDPATEDEYKAFFDVPLGSDYVTVELPIYAFADVNAGGTGGFDYTKLLQIVAVFGGIQGPEFTFAIDEITFTETSTRGIGPSTAFDSFDDGDVSDIGFFSGGAAGIGIGVGTTAGADGADAAGLSVGINPGDGGGFAGVVIPGPEGVTDVSGAEFLTFSFRPTTVQAANLPLKLEIALQEDEDGDGAHDPATEDEYKAFFDVPLGSDYVTVELPIYAFADVNAGGTGGFDYTKLLQIVAVFGGIQGPEFTFAIDEIGFASEAVVANEALPSTFAAAPVAFPNPTAGSASLTFELALTSDVSVEVYDLLGRRVATIAQGAQTAGAVRLSVPTGALTPGVYVVRVRTSAGVASTRLTVIR